MSASSNEHKGGVWRSEAFQHVILNRAASCAPKRFGGGATMKDLSTAINGYSDSCSGYCN
jgi:hypothetical protein